MKLSGPGVHSVYLEYNIKVKPFQSKFQRNGIFFRVTDAQKIAHYLDKSIVSLNAHGLENA